MTPPRGPHPDDCRGELARWAADRAKLAQAERAHADRLHTLSVRAWSSGMTGTEIARLAGVSRSTLYAGWTRRSDPPPEPVGGGEGDDSPAARRVELRAMLDRWARANGGLEEDAAITLAVGEVHAYRRERDTADDSPSPEEPDTPTEGEAR